MLSLLGAVASAPTDWVSEALVRGVQVPVTVSYVHTPPCAAPRMIEPLLRIASALIRPVTAWKAFEVRPFWTIGFGPWLVHAPPLAAPTGAPLSALPAALAALVRRAAACWMVIGSSPDRSRLQ